MAQSLSRRLFLAWLALAGVTLLAWWLGHRGGGEVASRDVVALGAIAITVIKVRVILREFMEVRTAPMLLKRLTDGWLALFAAAMLAVHFA